MRAVWRQEVAPSEIYKEFGVATKTLVLGHLPLQHVCVRCFHLMLLCCAAISTRLVVQSVRGCSILTYARTLDGALDRDRSYGSVHTLRMDKRHATRV